MLAVLTYRIVRWVSDKALSIIGSGGMGWGIVVFEGGYIF